ncbi:MAG: hypothetical protein SWJ54_04760 [Cyanobacteriota bacterium]|nr:hypothetical protein [Cyanobacteriota bacterium]
MKSFRIKPQKIIQSLMIISVLAVTQACTFQGLRSRTVMVGDWSDVPVSEIWEVEEVIDGTTLKVSKDQKTYQLQICGIEIIPGQEQQAVAYLKELVENSNNQVVLVDIKQDSQDQWFGEAFVSLGEDGEELAAALLILKKLANLSPDVSKCLYKKGLELAEELAEES